MPMFGGNSLRTGGLPRKFPLSRQPSGSVGRPACWALKRAAMAAFPSWSWLRSRPESPDAGASTLAVSVSDCRSCPCPCPCPNVHLSYPHITTTMVCPKPCSTREQAHWGTPLKPSLSPQANFTALYSDGEARVCTKLSLSRLDSQGALAMAPTPRSPKSQ